MGTIQQYQDQLEEFGQRFVIHHYEQQTPLTAEDYVIEQLKQMLRNPHNDEVKNNYNELEEVIFEIPPNSNQDEIYSLLDQVYAEIYPETLPGTEFVSTDTNQIGTEDMFNLDLDASDFNTEYNTTVSDSRLENIKDKLGMALINAGNKLLTLNIHKKGEA